MKDNKRGCKKKKRRDASTEEAAFSGRGIIDGDRVGAVAKQRDRQRSRPFLNPAPSFPVPRRLVRNRADNMIGSDHHADVVFHLQSLRGLRC
jgi:hypothetical protein